MFHRTQPAPADPIPEIHRDNFPSIRKYLADSDGVDVTGGMLLKVTQALGAAEQGGVTEIINGLEPATLQSLQRALSGETGLGTVIR